jgi:hypothetical protein
MFLNKLYIKKLVGHNFSFLDFLNIYFKFVLMQIFIFIIIFRFILKNKINTLKNLKIKSQET